MVNDGIARFTGLCLFTVVLATTAFAAPAKRTPASSPKSAAAGVTVKLNRVPDGGLQPQTVVDSAGTQHLIYYKGDAGAGDIFYVRRSPKSSDYSKPIRVNSQPGSAIAMGTIRGAQLAVGKGNRVHVAWNGSGKAEPMGPGKSANPMLYARLNDNGTAFEPQRNVVAQAYGLDGGGSVAADPEGNVYVAWHGNPNSDGEENRRVYVVHSSDDGQTFSTEAPADVQRNGACGCCGMRAFVDDGGKLYLIYRSARQDVNRDMYLLTSADRGNSFKGILLDKWMAPKCPMSNEAFANAPDAVLAAWETNGQVQLARIDKKTGQTRKPVAAPGGANGRKHPALAVNAKRETLAAQVIIQTVN